MMSWFEFLDPDEPEDLTLEFFSYTSQYIVCFVYASLSWVFNKGTCSQKNSSIPCDIGKVKNNQTLNPAYSIGRRYYNIPSGISILAQARLNFNFTHNCTYFKGNSPKHPLQWILQISFDIFYPLIRNF